jgi:hypothetical protein
LAAGAEADLLTDMLVSDKNAIAGARLPTLGNKRGHPIESDARGLFAYAASETSFPAIDAIERYLELAPLARRKAAAL